MQIRLFKRAVADYDLAIANHEIIAELMDDEIIIPEVPVNELPEVSLDTMIQYRNAVARYVRNAPGAAADERLVLAELNRAISYRESLINSIAYNQMNFGDVVEPQEQRM